MTWTLVKTTVLKNCFSTSMRKKKWQENSRTGAVLCYLIYLSTLFRERRMEDSFQVRTVSARGSLLAAGFPSAGHRVGSPSVLAKGLCSWCIFLCSNVDLLQVLIVQLKIFWSYKNMKAIWIYQQFWTLTFSWAGSLMMTCGPLSHPC